MSEQNCSLLCIRRGKGPFSDNYNIVIWQTEASNNILSRAKIGSMFGHYQCLMNSNLFISRSIVSAKRLCMVFQPRLDNPFLRIVRISAKGKSLLAANNSSAEKGATVVEMCIVCLLAIPFMILACHMLLTCFRVVTLQFVATQVLRQSIYDDTSVAAAKQSVVDLAKVFSVEIPLDHVYICPVLSTVDASGNLTDNRKCLTGSDAITNSELMTIYIEETYQPPFLNQLGLDDITFGALAVARTEPWSS